jgi:PAS domain S-box-containing protein
MMAFDTERFAVTLLHSMSDAVVCSDAKGRIRYRNTGAERMFGYSAAEVLGQLLDIIIAVRSKSE